jgi:hypothetical protein
MGCPERIDFTDTERIAVRGLRDSSHKHLRFVEPHVLLRIGREIVDVTRTQVDERDHPWKVYASLADVSEDWEEVSDWS